jgi:hypothetical protein
LEGECWNGRSGNSRRDRAAKSESEVANINGNWCIIVVDSCVVAKRTFLGRRLGNICLVVATWK